MQTLFGHLCSGKEFAHDRHMRETVIDQDQERPRKRPKYTPEPDSVSRTDETGSREPQSTSQSFVSTTCAASFHLSKKEVHTSSPYVAEAPISTDSDNIEVLNTPEQQNPIEQGIKRTHEIISSSPPSSFSQPHMRKLQAIKQAMKAPPARQTSDNRLILQPEESPPQVRELQKDLGDELEEEAAPDSPEMDIIEIANDEDLGNTHDDIHYEEDSEPEIESQNTIISYSAFGSQQDTLDDMSTSPWPTLLRRAEAYSATRSGTFTDWLDYAPVSSGNNHTKEEIEL